MQQRNRAIRHRRTKREQKESNRPVDAVQVECIAVDVEMQLRNPAIRHRRTKREQKEPFVRIHSRHSQSLMLDILRKPTTRRHRPSEAVEVQVAKRPVNVVMQQRNPAIRHRRTDSGQREPFDRIQSTHCLSVMLYILRKPTTRRHQSSEAVELNVANRLT